MVAEAENTIGKLTTIANWYGEREREVEIASETAVWYSTGLFAVPLRWVLVRDPRGEFKTQALLCTDNVDPEKILSWFVMRWQLEVTFPISTMLVAFPAPFVGIPCFVVDRMLFYLHMPIRGVVDRCVHLGSHQ